MTSRYSLIKQPNISDATITEYIIKDTTDSVTEAIQEIFLDLSSNTVALSSLSSTFTFAAGPTVTWLGEPATEGGEPTFLNTIDNAEAIPIGVLITNQGNQIFDAIDNTTGVVLFSIAQANENIIDIGLSGYKETASGLEISFASDMPSYKSIGSNNNSSSSVNIEGKEYDANTGVVEFNVFDAHSRDYGVNGEHHYHWQVLSVDGTKLYTDNGGTDDLAADGTTAEATPGDDETMGVYLNMRDGLASALVPELNDTTEALAAEIVTNPGPAVSHDGLAHTIGLNALDVSNGGTVDWVDGGGSGEGPDGAGTFDQAIAIDLYIDMAALLDAEQHMANGGIVNGIHLDYYFNTGAPPIRDGEMVWSELADNDFVNSGLWSYSSGAGVIDNGNNTGTIWLHLYENSDLHNALSSQGTEQAKIGTLFFDAEEFTEQDISGLTITEARVVELSSSSASYQTPTSEFAIGSPRSVEYKLDGSYALDPMSLPWVVELSAEDDIYIGRDDQDVGGGVYNTTVEGILYSAGNDDIDMGLGYNFANFQDESITSLDIDLHTYPGYNSSNVTVETMEADGLTPVTYSQKFIGVNEVHGSFGSNTISGNDNDPYNHPSDDIWFGRYSYDDGATWIENTSGEYGDNYIIANGAYSTIKGFGGDDMLHAYIANDVFLDADNLTDFNADASSLYGAAMYGGRGADSLYGGIYVDDLEGGDYRGDRDNKDIDTDDFYNYTGHDFAAFDFGFSSPPASNLKAMTNLTIAGTDYAIDTSTITEDDTPLTALDKFLAAANAAINAVTQQSELWEYLTADDEGMTLHFAQGLSSPIPVNESGYYYSEEQVHHNEVNIPSWAPAFFDASGTSQMVANGFAPSGEFVENTGDDNDRFMYFREIHANPTQYDDGNNTYDNANLSAINGDTIWDLDIGQNSLTLTSEIGEGIWFDAGVVNHNVEVDVTETVTASGNEYSATVTLAHATDATKTVDFVLEELNLPTLALSGDQFYNLVGTWETVKMEAGMLHDGFNGIHDAAAAESIWMAKDIDILRFEWQAVGEKVGTAGTDNLVGTNGSNVFQAYGGNDVLNGSGGADSYHFTGNFGQDKILEFGDDADSDAVQIGAAMNDVWIEREGRRGDDLKITVKSADTSGQISVGRHYNPYSNLTSVEEIHFGFDGEKSAEADKFSISNGSDDWHQDADIFVMRNGEESVDVVNSSSDSYVYMNQLETSGTTTVSFYESFGSASMAEVDLMIDYGAASHSDKLSVETMITSGEKGGTVHLVSKGQVAITTGNFGDVSITADGANGYAVEMLTDPMDVNSSELLFNLIWEDASTWAV